MSFLGGDGFALVHRHELMSLSSLVPPFRISSVSDSDGSTTNEFGLDTVVPLGIEYPGAKVQVVGFALQIRSQSSAASGGGLTAVLAFLSSWNTPRSWTAIAP